MNLSHINHLTINYSRNNNNNLVLNRLFKNYRKQCPGLEYLK